MTLGFGLFLGAYSRLITIIIEGGNQLEIANLIHILRDPTIRGRLSSKYYSKICFLVQMLLPLKRTLEITPLLVFLILISLTVYSYLTPSVTFSCTIILGCFFWTLIEWLMIFVFFQDS
jgi:hypothetical protein